MATVKFRLRKVKSKEYPILVRLLVNKDSDFQAKTGFTINPKDWSNASRKPKQNCEANKKLFNDLLKLEKHLFENLNDANSKGETINRFWIENTIQDCFNRINRKDKNNNLLTHQIQHIIDNANTRKITGTSKVGLSINRIKGYYTFLNLIKRYETEIKKEIRLTDIDNIFTDKLINWLMNKNGYSVNYSGKTIDNLKTVCLDAKKRGIKTNDYATQITSFKESKEDKHIITLSFEELEQIRTKELSKDYLINARKWLLIGCEIGQRGNDLLNITKENIRYSNNNLMLDIYQKKTGKTVTVPIAKDYIKDIITKEMPHKISIQKLNTYFKKLCQVCEIDEITKGKKLNPETKRQKIDDYKKHELISSHICRRSFATNYYKLIPTPVLIEITGHSKESMFLEYIGKPKDKDENAKLFLKLISEINSKKKPQLKKVN